jgi:hypothetical protein
MLPGGGNRMKKRVIAAVLVTAVCALSWSADWLGDVLTLRGRMDTDQVVGILDSVAFEFSYWVNDEVPTEGDVRAGFSVFEYVNATVNGETAAVCEVVIKEYGLSQIVARREFDTAPLARRFCQALVDRLRVDWLSDPKPIATPTADLLAAGMLGDSQSPNSVDAYLMPNYYLTLRGVQVELLLIYPY